MFGQTVLAKACIQAGSMVKKLTLLYTILRRLLMLYFEQTVSLPTWQFSGGDTAILNVPIV